VARSNAVPFQVVDVAPLLDTGIEVKVIHRRDYELLCRGGNTARPIAVLNRFLDTWVTTEINGLGAGSITLDLDDEFWATPLGNGEPAMMLMEYEHLFQVYENGALRGGFLGQTVNEAILPSGNGPVRTVTISGPGPADVLRQGVIMTPWYPDPMPTGVTENPYRFKRVPVMAAWLVLFGDANKRGTLDFVCPGFTKDVDCGGRPWEDTPDPTEDPNYVTSILSGDVNFFIDSHTLTQAARNTLNGFVSHFNMMDAPQLTIVGHTDSTNTHAYNQALSERRANSVAEFIRAAYDRVVLNVSGKGETQPIATNKTVRGREYNRRVTVTYPVGPPYTPQTAITIEPGMNLLEALIEWTGFNLDRGAPLRAEWHMYPDFKLAVCHSFGTRREQDVVFYEGSTASISKSRDRRRADIRNLIAEQAAGNGKFSIVADTDSIDRWGQREFYETQGSGFADDARTAIAQAQLDLQKNESASWTVQVDPYATGRRVYEDYGLGDWIGLSRFLGGVYNTVEAFRVMAITVKVAGDGQMATELTLQSTQEHYLVKLRDRLASMLKKRSTKVYVQDEVPVSARVGDLWTPATTYGANQLNNQF
jgi:hypothetical protein